jgi:hypothetical protein
LPDRVEARPARFTRETSVLNCPAFTAVVTMLACFVAAADGAEAEAAGAAAMAAVATSAVVIRRVCMAYS